MSMPNLSPTKAGLVALLRSGQAHRHLPLRLGPREGGELASEDGEWTIWRRDFPAGTEPPAIVRSPAELDGLKVRTSPLISASSADELAARLESMPDADWPWSGDDEALDRYLIRNRYRTPSEIAEFIESLRQVLAETSLDHSSVWSIFERLLGQDEETQTRMHSKDASGAFVLHAIQMHFLGAAFEHAPEADHMPMVRTVSEMMEAVLEK